MSPRPRLSARSTQSVAEARTAVARSGDANDLSALASPISDLAAVTPRPAKKLS